MSLKGQVPLLTTRPFCPKEHSTWLEFHWLGDLQQLQCQPSMGLGPNKDVEDAEWGEMYTVTCNYQLMPEAKPKEKGGAEERHLFLSLPKAVNTAPRNYQLSLR